MIRALQIADCGLMAELHAACFERGWSVQAFSGLMQKSGAVAYGDESGFVFLQPHEAAWEILTLAVAPSARRQGRARALLGKAFDLAGTAPIWLEVAADNAAAKALYAAHDFEETGRRKAYYKRAGQTRVDALLMRREGKQG